MTANAIGIPNGVTFGNENLTTYDEGTWTPTDASGAGLSLTVVGAKYTRIGRTVTIVANITFPATASSANVNIGGLPFAPIDDIHGLCIGYTTINPAPTILIESVSSGKIGLYTTTGGGSGLLNSTVSGKNIRFSGTYTI